MSGTSFGEWITAYPQSRILRLVHKAPIMLWRLGLGSLAGRVFVLVTTRGRKSGLPRRTVVSWHLMGGRIYSPCPYGERAEWYRNVVAHPRVTIQAHRRPESAEAVRVTDDDELTRFYRLLELATGPPSNTCSTRPASLTIRPRWRRTRTAST